MSFICKENIRTCSFAWECTFFWYNWKNTISADEPT